MKREKSPNQKAPVITKKVIRVAKPVEEPIPEIDTAKAVAFAMSIAMEMKQKQKKEDEARKSETAIVYRQRNQQYSEKELDTFRQKLLATRDAFTTGASSMKDTASLNESDDVEPDGGDGTSQTMRIDAINHLEKTNKSINDIDAALHRIDDGTYGICMTCGCLIDKNRLLHSPFVKTCTSCQQVLESAR